MKHADEGIRLPAAQYIRKSTEHQRYSADHQAAAIELYAVAHGYEVVRTYADLGRSGLTLENRPALQQLLSDVNSPEAGFSAILVYDVSRWGRFQDPDEAAVYEHACKRAGMAVHYCAELFDNDGSPTATILKAIKRVMAAEYSRELSEKILGSLRRTAEQGHLACRWAPFGTRRMLVNKHGEHVRLLGKGEGTMRGHHVMLVPGPPEEVECVRRIFRLFGRQGWTMSRIARALNDERVRALGGGTWTYSSVRNLLHSEVYIGNNVYGRTTSKLGGPVRPAPQADWIRVEGAFQPIVSRKLFRAVQRRLSASPPTDDEMITAVAGLLAKRGYLTRAMVEAERGMLSAQVYVRRFGSMAEVYRRIGYRPDGTVNVATIVQASCVERDRIRDEVAEQFAATGRHVRVFQHLSRITVGDDLIIDVRACRVMTVPRHSPYWVYADARQSRPSLTLIARLDQTFQRLDYCLTTPRGFRGCKVLRMPASLIDRDGLEVFKSLDGIDQRCSRLLAH